MDGPGIRLERAGGVLTVWLDRPASRNSLDLPAFDALADAMEAAVDDTSTRVVVLRGAGGTFCAGADLGGLADPAAAAAGGAPTLDAAARIVTAVTTMPRPVVAVVEGAAAGIGVSLALACDLVVSAESAFFLLAFANIGLMPDGGATALVTAAVGRARAMRMALLAERIPAATAFDWGLVSHLVADDELDATMGDLIGKLAAGPTAAYARTKDAVRRAALELLHDALTREREGQLALFGTTDFAEGVTAFRERRPARFAGS